jgi:serine protease Do
MTMTPGVLDECWYKPVEVGGIGAELVNFFLRENAKQLEGDRYVPRTLSDFLDVCPQRHRERHKDIGFEVRRYCHNLMAEALLFPAGFDTEQERERPYDERFISFSLFKDLAAYGSYDFVALGYPEMRRHFEPSVIRLGVLKDDEEKEIWGTAFLIENNRLITAAHCLEERTRVTIDGWDPDTAPLESIKMFGTPDPTCPVFFTRSRIDLALLQFKADPFPTAPKFRLWGASMLDDALVMGYPQMMGFAPGLIAGTGQIIGEHFSTARNQPLVLVDARMKGGNSGGPVLNRLGKVMGVVTNALTDEEQNFDQLGYGLATPAQTLLDLIRACEKEPDKILEIRHEVSNGTIRIPKQR